MIEKVLLVSLIAFAFGAIQTRKMLRAIIYTGIFSLLMSFVYLLYRAPDVAMAEASIGVALTTVMYLVTMKKTKFFMICFTEENEEFRDKGIRKTRRKYLQPLEKFLADRELDPRVIFTHENPKTIIENDNFDVIIHKEKEKIQVYGNAENELFPEIQLFFEKQGNGFHNIEVIPYGEVSKKHEERS